MKKEMTYQHLDTERLLKVEFELYEKDGHWVAQLHPLEEGEEGTRTPTFYGTTREQAERQLRKVLEKDCELLEERIIST